MGLLNLSDLDNEHLNLANDLSRSLITANYRKNKLNISMTCQCIDKLCSRHSKSKVYDIIQWYISQAGQEYSIKISSIKDIERKFPQLLRNYSSKQPKLEEHIPEILIGMFDPVPLTVAAQKVLLYCGNPSFPDDFDHLQFTKWCLYFIDDFQERLKITENNPSSVGLNKDSKTYRLNNFIRSRYVDPIQLCVNWINKILPVIWKVKNYNYRSLFPLMGASPIFEAMMKNEANRFCADESEWVTVKFYLGKVK